MAAFLSLASVPQSTCVADPVTKRQNGRMTSGRTISALTWRFILWGLASIIVGVLLGVALSSLGWENGLDEGWMAFMSSIRSDFLTSIAKTFDYLGGGWRATYVVPLGLVAVFLLLRRPWSAVVIVVASLLSVGIVQLFKKLFARARPEDMLVHSDFGSFPSGHAANAATLMVALALLLRTTWIWIVAVIWVLFMALSRNYLGAHWLTDTFAGVLIGVGASLIVVGAFSTLLARERHSPYAEAASIG